MIDNTHKTPEDILNKSTALKQLIAGVFWVTVVTVSLSLSRVHYTGWLDIYYLHIVFGLATSCVFIFRNRTPFRLQLFFVLLIPLAIATSNMLFMGIFGTGVLWSIFTLLTAVVFASKRNTMLLSVFLGIVYGYSCYLFTMTGKKFPVDANLYLSNPHSWALVFFGAGIFIALIIIVFKNQNDVMETLLTKLEKKNKEITRLANYDNLTGLPVIRLFLESVKNSLLQQKREQRFISVLFMDLDGFKQINDTHGHDAGDFILKNVASRILTCIRENDVAARMGGDEFLILVNSTDNVDIAGLCNRIIKSIQEPYDFDGKEISVGVSIGVVQLNRNSNIKEPETLIKLADEAMYEVKKNGKNAYNIKPDA
jgi:diguanylate cyclase (GGDEF)-like protein